MHTSFEDLRDHTLGISTYRPENPSEILSKPPEGSIGHIVDGELVWERPRTKKEAGQREFFTLWAVALACAFPGAFALMYLWLAY